MEQRNGFESAVLKLSESQEGKEMEMSMNIHKCINLSDIYYVLELGFAGMKSPSREPPS